MRLLLFSLFILTASAATAQWDNLKFASLHTKEGLSQNTIQSILEDDMGFMWFGTQDGLNRYDSYKFTLFRKQSSTDYPLNGNDVKAIAQDKDKLIWVSTADGNTLNIINPITGKFLDISKITDGDINLSNVVHITPTQKGGLLLSSRTSGLLIYDYSTKKIRTSVVEDPVMFAREDKKGNIWVATENNQIIVLSSDRKIRNRYDLQPNGKSGQNTYHISSLFIGKEETIWIGTYGAGLFKYDKSKNAFTEVHIHHTRTPNPKYILSLSEDISGQLWIGTDKDGLIIYNEDNQQVFTYKSDANDQNSLPDNTISSIYKDRKGNMWVGTPKSGISLVNIDQINLRHFRKSNDAYSLSHNMVNCVFQDREKQIWVGTDGGGINLFNSITSKFVNSDNSKDFRFLEKGTAVISINEDLNNNIWIGTWGKGLFIYDKKRKTAKAFHSDNLSLLKNNSITAIVRLDNKMYLGTYGDGLLIYDLKTNIWTSYTPYDQADYVNSNYILSLQVSKKGQILIGTEDGGLNVLNLQNGRANIINTTTKLNGTPLSNNSIHSIHEDKDGHIWLGTAYGLNKLNIDKKSNSIYTTSNAKLNNDVVHSVQEDVFGSIWVTTNWGISRLNPATNVFQDYNTSLGLQRSQFRKAKLLDNEGLVYFGGNDGLHIINPSKLNAIVFTPTLVITNFQLNNKTINIGNNDEYSPFNGSVTYANTLKLNYDHNVFMFEFASLNYIDPQSKKYEYMIEGQDADWQPLGSKNSLSFVRMRYGNYTLKLRTTDNLGNWSPNILSLRIEIPPPFWQTWWFRICLSLSIAIIFFLIYKKRVQSIQIKNKNLEKKVALKTVELSKRNEEILHQNISLEHKNVEIAKINSQITKQQTKILQQNNKLLQVVNELKTNNQMKDKFFSILAHDLKNPLTTVSSLVDVLKENLEYLSKEEINHHLNDFKHSTNSINNLLINLLEWGKSKTNKLFFRPTKFNLYELIQKVIYLFDIPLREKNISCQIDIDSSVYITADYHMLYTIIRNIIGNSVKFTHTNGQINIRNTASQNLELIIEDNGIGMDAQQIKDIFDQRYSTMDGTNGEKGTGLGFQICQEFIKAHQGNFHIISDKGKGTKFIISLPIMEDQDTTPPIKSNVQEDESWSKNLSKYEGKKILIIDDNKQIRTILHKLLGRIFLIEEAENGKMGLAKASEQQPDLIITDLIMPEMDGLVFCKKIKGDINTSHIPILMLTGETDDEHQILSYKAGADIYLKKPFNKNLLYTVIGKFLEKKDQQQQQLSNNIMPEDAHTLSNLDLEFLDMMRTYVLHNIADIDLNYKKVCSHFGISRSVLYAKFKSLTGQGVHDFIKNIRLEESIVLLKEGKLNISQVAYAVGFNSVSYYSKSFAKRMNKSPKEFLKDKYD